jgi:hypothetical protein
MSCSATNLSEELGTRDVSDFFFCKDSQDMFGAADEAAR